jgi:Tfp pilus assembly protein PilN
MHDIDFLPQEYRQRHARRQKNSWRLAVLVGCAAVMAAIAVMQYRSLRRARTELKALLPKHEQAVEQNVRLSQLQAELQAAEADAALLAYLRHPWPRSQILATLLEPLPEAIVFEELSIGPAGDPRRGLRVPPRHAGQNRQSPEQLDGLPPAERDLKALREENDGQQISVSISGTTTDAASLHEYLGKLGASELIDEADLRSIEGENSEGQGLMRFSAVVVIRPGYGQPGGPHAAIADESSPATTKTEIDATPTTGSNPRPRARTGEQAGDPTGRLTAAAG